MSEPETLQQESRTTARTGPVVFFDFARGVSAQAVVLGHALNIFLPAIFMPPGGHVFYIQSFAVIIFFVLSGFLITSAVLKKKDREDFTFGSYLIDRVARVIYPLIPALGLILAGDLLMFGRSTRLPFDYVDLEPQTVVAAFTMLFNHPVLLELAPAAGLPWLSAGPLGTGAPLWSVVAEWWIYVAFGVLAFIAVKKLKAGVGTGILLAFSIAVPLGYMAKGGYESLAWVIGMLYALAAHRMSSLPKAFHTMMLLVGLGGLLAGLWYTKMNLHSAATVIPSAVAFCHLYFLGTDPGSRTRVSREGRFQRVYRSGSLFLSSYSYSLYLLHFSVVTYLWVLLHGRIPTAGLILVSVLLSNAVAYVFHLLVERHFHRVGKFLKRRLLRSNQY
ncbi:MULTISPECIES: acyltransferase family protein [Arthrobacter]|uniref:Acyltransferase family protein n=2 Tax=Arthrobacter TaxID=1663 RepID=A0ABU9KJK5_9MICC|nr:acyltransferase family protein [Arthrobacter sp. YJM1]MDP5227252.1 acyltransferase family protein [Arthrobacter sp. YJM1]